MEKAKRKAAEQVRDAAAELLNIYARRAARQGHAFRLNAHDYEQFAEDFGFEETADQQAAINAVVHDLISPQPDGPPGVRRCGLWQDRGGPARRLCGRHGGKQVAFLAPTTLLAEQHYQTLVDRFAKWPVRIAEMSRFRTTKEINAALKGLAEGSIDIVVGTHKLLSANTKFKDLGLLIIDEEHRFGVRHKEAMKQLRAEVDVLDADRHPHSPHHGHGAGRIARFIGDCHRPATAPGYQNLCALRSQGVIREAVLREFKRGGQVYFLHNEVDTIENRRRSSARNPARGAHRHRPRPDARARAGARDARLCRPALQPAAVLHHHRNRHRRAHRQHHHHGAGRQVGLAQLHQLRGRVGRSHHQAYAYLMVPDVQSLTKQAQQRLEAIQEMEELGSGFYLAMHDLEIRGAGEVLGDNQSGNMTEIGFQLYNEMLAEAVRSLKAGHEPDLLSPLQAATDINLHAPALLPSDYCGDVQLRLSLYKKLASAKTSARSMRLLEEIVDRFGKLPRTKRKP